MLNLSLRSAIYAVICFVLATPVVAEGPGSTMGGIAQVTRLSNQAFASLDPDRLRSIMRPRGSVSSVLNYTRADVDALPMADGGAQWACLTEALYFEARGEKVVGQIAVAEVIMNRAKSSRFPNTVCEVVHQGTGRLHACQFSYRCDGLSEAAANGRAWERVGKIARMMLDGIPERITNGATYYHTTAVNPNWSRVFERTAEHGVHLFYRPS